MTPAIELRNVTKVYRRYGGRQFSTLKSALLQRSILRDLNPAETFQALNDVSFEVPKGSTFGVVGRNGSGKSTTLKLVAGITKPTSGSVTVRADDLWQALELLEGVALGDALRAAGDVDLDAALPEHPRNSLGRARVHRRAHDHERAIADMRRHLVDDTVEERHRRIEELVNGRANHDDHDGRAAQRRWVARQREPLGRQDPGEQLFGASLHERHLAAFYARDGLLVDVVDAHPQTRVGKCQRERQTDVAAAADNAHVGRLGGRCGGVDTALD